MMGIKARGLVLAAALGGLSAASTGPAYADGDGVWFKNFLGTLGIIESERAPIEYRERPPLVVPPEIKLRPPVPREAVEANPQWPRDPDVRAARRRAAEERRLPTESTTRRLNSNETRLTPDELRATRRAGAAIPNGPEDTSRKGDGRDSYWVRPDFLKAQGRKSDEEVLIAGEPTRRRLDQPPGGYRKPIGGPVKRDFQPVIREEDQSDAGGYARERASR
jgi:hypothetical protein